jgi:membrane AbrB-like protein
MTPARAGRLAATLLLGLAAALAWQALRLPLPWMVGPLLATAACGVAGMPLLASTRLRNLGQGAIGLALGLYFTPEVVALLLRLAPAMLAAAAWAFAIGYAFYRFLWRVQGGNRSTAFFAASIGGASEMALLAERHGGQVDRVAASHTLRLMLVVSIIPLGYQALGVHGADPSALAVHAVRPAGLAVLLAASLAGVALLARAGAPNPWVLGALGASGLITASGMELSALPREFSNAGQLFIGVALGARFTPAFMHAAPRWLGAVAVGTLAMIGSSAAFAAGLAWTAGLHPATVFLGASPGGIAEMCITAKVLQLGVPVVTAFQVVRYVTVLTLTPRVYRWEMRRAARRGG